MTGDGLRGKTGRLVGALLALSLLLLFSAPAAAAQQDTARAAAGASTLREQIRQGREFLPDDPASAAERAREVRESMEYPRTEPPSFQAASVLAGAKGVTVSIPFDTVNGWISHPDGDVRVELWRGAVQVYTDDITALPDGFFYFDFTPPSVPPYADVLNGDRVRITDLDDAVPAPVDVNVNLTGVVTPAADQVVGTTAAGNTVDVYINTPSFYYCDTPPGADHQRAALSGTGYAATFTEFPLRVGDAAYVFSTYPSGHRVQETARGGSGYSLVVYPQNDEVWGYAEPSCDITVNVGASSRSVCSEGDGLFDAWFATHDILPGEVVSSNISGVPKSITVADVFARADPGTNKVDGKAPPSELIRVTVTPYTDPVTVETQTDEAGNFVVDLDGLTTLQGNEVFNVAWYDADFDCVVYNYNTYSWYLPEGYTGPGFDEWVLIMNPSTVGVEVRVIFQTTGGPVNGPLFTAPANSRSSIHVNEYVPNTMVSTLVTSVDGGQIIAERAMYMYGTIDGKWGSHDCVGILTPSPVWYLPEGYTGPGFDEWVLVQNPNAREVTVEVLFLTPAGVGKQYDIVIPAMSRYSIHVNEVVPNSDVSTRLTSRTEVDDQALPIYAERAMYMINTPDGKVGAHDSIGLSSARMKWYMPEGTTRPGFDEWVLIMNPNATPVKVTVSFYNPSGESWLREYDLAPQSRYSVHANEIVPNEDISTVVECTEGAGVLAERAMYIDTVDGKLGAHDSIGAYAASTLWVLPEGTTRPGFDEWVLVQNPNDQAVAVRVTLLGPNGEAGRRDLNMAPFSRQSVHVNEMVNNLDVSVKVQSTGINPLGILAERAMYMWTVDNKQGAHDSIGLPWADIFPY